MELTLDTGLSCPKCKKKIEVETGFLGGMFMAEVFERVKREGATITCPHCNQKSWIEPKPKKSFWEKLF